MDITFIYCKAKQIKGIDDQQIHIFAMGSYEEIGCFHTHTSSIICEYWNLTINETELATSFCK